MSNWNETFQQSMQLARATTQAATEVRAPINEDRRQTQYTLAMTEAQSAIFDFEQNLVNNPNWEEYDELYTQEVASIRERILNEREMDPQVVQAFENSYIGVAEQNRQTVVQLADRRARAQRRVDLERSLDSASQWGDPVQAHGHISRAVQSAYEEGMITEDERYQLQEEWDGKILLNQARLETTQILNESEDRELGYSEAIAFARDPSNGLNDQQRQQLVAEMRDQRSEFDRERREADTRFDNDAYQLMYGPRMELTYSYIDDPDNGASRQTRMYWRAQLDNFFSSIEDEREGRIEEASSRHKTRLQADIDRRGSDWMSIYEQGLDLTLNGHMSESDWNQVRTYLERSTQHPFNQAHNIFDEMVNELELDAETTQRRREQLEELLRANYYTADGQIRPEDDRIGLDDIRDIARNMARDITFDRINTRDFEFGRNASGLFGRDRDAVSVTRALQSGQLAMIYGRDQDTADMVLEVSRGHQRMMESAFGREPDNIRRASTGHAIFEYEGLEYRVGYDEDEQHLALQVWDGRRNAWAIIDHEVVAPEETPGTAAPTATQDQAARIDEGGSVGTPRRTVAESGISDALRDDFSTQWTTLGRGIDNRQAVDTVVETISNRHHLTQEETRVILADDPRNETWGIQASDQDRARAEQMQVLTEEYEPQLVPIMVDAIENKGFLESEAGAIRRAARDFAADHRNLTRDEAIMIFRRYQERMR